MLDDGFLEVTRESKRRVAQVVRKYRPRLALIPYYKGRHPDHYHASDIAYEGIFLAGLARFDTGQEAHRPTKLLYYMTRQEFDPTFVVDISAQFERKMEAIYAYATQFRPEVGDWGQTRLTAPGFRTSLEHWMGYYGSMIGVAYGEGFIVRGTLAVDDPLNLTFASF